jgi:SpoVK/Ycf46/Vps4 family AAA+-type ATPase
MLKALGLLSKGHLVETDRSGLVAGYVGQTEAKTDQKISEALGGMLFIDEAYSLYKGKDTQSDYGGEAISILLKRMEDHRDDFVVIVAGYDKPMAEFLQSNEGLKSRFSTNIRFPDYSPKELLEIFELFCNEGNYEIQATALELVQYIFENEYRNRDERFGNGRLVRNLFQSIVRNQSVRIAETIKKPSHSDLVKLLPEDIRPLLEKKQEPIAPSY